MLPEEHFLLGLFPMIQLWTVYNPTFAMAFVVASVLIDVDHYLAVVYITKFKEWSLEKAYYFFKKKHHKKYHIDLIYIFHTIEWLGFVFLIYWFTKNIYILAVLFGLIYHIIWDALEVIFFKIKHKKIKFKHMSIIWYLIKRCFSKRTKNIKK